MSKGLLAWTVVLLAGAGSAFAQSPVAQDGAIATAPAPAVASVDGYHLNPADCAGPFDECAQTWMRGEYLVWWTKASPNPTPMVTSVAAGTPNGGTPIPGAIGGAGTSVVMGGEDIDLGARLGARFTLGHWLNPSQTVGLEANYFFLQSSEVTQTVTSAGGPGSPILHVPFFDVTGSFTGGTPGQSALPNVLGTLFAVPGGLNGPFVSRDVLSLRSESQGAELNGIFNLSKNGRVRIDGLAGFRYVNLYEQLDFSTATATVPPQTSVTYDTLDQFHTTNNFYGGQLGLRMEVSPDNGTGGALGGLCFRGTAKLALGDMSEGAMVKGGTLTNLGNPLLTSPAEFVGGIFAQPSNIGYYDHQQFAVVPEVDLNIGYAVFTWLRIYLGYDFLFISDVARPGNQISPNINMYGSGLVHASGIAPPANNPVAPTFGFNQSSFWAQGLNVGFEARF